MPVNSRLIMSRGMYSTSLGSLMSTKYWRSCAQLTFLKRLRSSVNTSGEDRPSNEQLGRSLDYARLSSGVYTNTFGPYNNHFDWDNFLISTSNFSLDLHELHLSFEALNSGVVRQTLSVAPLSKSALRLGKIVYQDTVNETRRWRILPGLQEA